jgi:hypothetical protein
MVHKLPDTVLQLGIKKDGRGKRLEYSHFIPATSGSKVKDRDFEHATMTYPELDVYYTNVYVDGVIVGWAMFYQRKK